MSTNIKTNWMQDFNGDLFAPKTLVESIQNKEGTPLEELLGQGGGATEADLFISNKLPKTVNDVSTGIKSNFSLLEKTTISNSSGYITRSATFSANLSNYETVDIKVYYNDEYIITNYNVIDILNKSITVPGPSSNSISMTISDTGVSNIDCYYNMSLEFIVQNVELITNVKTDWLKDKEDNLFSPRILMDSIQDNNGTTLKDYINSSLGVEEDLIPKQTSNNDNIIYSSVSFDRQPYCAFDKNEETRWSGGNAVDNINYVGYIFDSIKTITKVSIKFTCDNNSFYCKIQGRNNSNEEWRDISNLYSITSTYSTITEYIFYCNEEEVKEIRLCFIDSPSPLASSSYGFNLWEMTVLGFNKTSKKSNATDISYDNTKSQLEATNVQIAIDELKATLGDIETVLDYILGNISESTIYKVFDGTGVGTGGEFTIDN